MCELYFRNEGLRWKAREGQTLLEAAVEAGISPDAPCGGKGSCGKCRVRVNGEPVLACQTKAADGMEIDTLWEREQDTQILTEGHTEDRKKTIVNPGTLPGDVKDPLLAAADVGSTSVVVYLMDARTGRELAVRSMLNPQRQYGADVVERGNYVLKHGPEQLYRCIRRAVSDLLAQAAEAAGRTAEDIVRVALVSNSCIHHLFLGLPIDTLVKAPYDPVVKGALKLPAAKFDVRIHPQGEIFWLPNIGGFVGADTVGGILASRIYEKEKPTLLVDIGTNGEIVLGDRQGLMACSTAAGPAFEGAKITCGMRGTEGAIDKVWLENGKLSWHVIGEGEPKGICGSGLLDATACLLRLGKLDETGRMEEQTVSFTEQVYLNQRDIRELQLAKAAICAGIRLLCSHRGIEVDEIDTLLIAGAFGNYMNPASACAIGLLPPELENRILSIGNAAGEGAKMAVLNQEEFKRSSRLSEETRFVELALERNFQDVYVEELLFPEEEE